MLGDLLTGVLLILVMVVSSGLAVNIFEKLARGVQTNRLILATILVGFSTSLPELFVGLAAALRHQPQIALGDIVGANLANLSWIIGGAALMFGSVPVVGEYLRDELWITTGMAMAPFLLVSDGILSRLDGLILLLLYIFYLKMTLRRGGTIIKHLKLNGRKKTVHRVITKAGRWLQMVKLVFSLGVLGLSAWALINLAMKAADGLGVSAFWIGLVIIAIGTTLPELIFTLLASEKREISLILGNIFGSVVVNSTLILGIIAVISPIVYTDSLQRGISGMFLLMILGLFWLFTKSKHKLERWEGAVLVGVYGMFIGLQMMIA